MRYGSQPFFLRFAMKAEKEWLATMSDAYGIFLRLLRGAWIVTTFTRDILFPLREKIVKRYLRLNTAAVLAFLHSVSGYHGQVQGFLRLCLTAEGLNLVAKLGIVVNIQTHVGISIILQHSDENTCFLSHFPVGINVFTAISDGRLPPWANWILGYNSTKKLWNDQLFCKQNAAKVYFYCFCVARSQEQY